MEFAAVSPSLVLITIAVLQFTLLPLVADLSPSHAANATWPPHARFHVVTQVLATSSVGIVALYFLWSGRVDATLGMCIATALGATALGAFFLSWATARFYGGSVRPDGGFAATRWSRIDGNVANFGSASLLLLVGRLVA